MSWGQIHVLLRKEHSVDLLLVKVDSAFHPYGVGKMSTSFCWGLTCDKLVSRPREVNDSHPLNTTETGDRCRLQWATFLKFRLRTSIFSTCENEKTRTDLFVLLWCFILQPYCSTIPLPYHFQDFLDLLKMHSSLISCQQRLLSTEADEILQAQSISVSASVNHQYCNVYSTEPTGVGGH